MLEHDQDPLSHKSCWILSDGRPGHRNQSLGLAHALALKNIQTQELTFRRFGKLLGIFNIHWRFNNVPSTPYPDILIGCGSHIAPLSAYIKRRSPTTFAIHLMNMPRARGLFDVIALPAHADSLIEDSSIIKTQGALNNIQPAYLKEESTRWASRLKHMPKPCTAVLVGGNSRHFQFTPECAAALAEDLVAFAKKSKTSLLIATSRRTPDVLVRTLTNALDAAQTPYFLWDTNAPDTNDNPYHAFLGSAKNVIVTADSVSMLSEAATSGKTTLIWGRTFMQKAKFKRFYEKLLAQKAIADVDAFTNKTKTTQLQEAKRVAGFVRGQYLRRSVNK